MEYTGERITDTDGGRTEATEYYKLARQYVKGATLDAACGIGWGSEILCLAYSPNSPISYVGGDISAEAIDHARKNYLRSHTSFFQMDITNLGWINTFDTYVSIETIEHVVETQLDNVFRSAHRALKKGGIYFLSTPDYNVIPYRPTSLAEVRGYHYRHYTDEELKNALYMFSDVQVVKLWKESSLIVIATK